MIEFFTMFSGSSGNCTYLSDGDVRILIDAGVSAKRIAAALLDNSIDIKSINAILITHEHSDHISGVEVLSRRYKIPVFANERTFFNMTLSEQAKEMVNIIKTNSQFNIGDLKITAFNTPHDTPESVGYVFEDYKSGKKIGYASDLGHISDEVGNSLTGCEAVFIESNHDRDMLLNGPYPYFLKKRIAHENGHLSNQDCSGFLTRLCSAGTSRIMLGHLSRENNLPSLAFDTACGALKNKNIVAGKDVALLVAPCVNRSDVISI